MLFGLGHNKPVIWQIKVLSSVVYGWTYSGYNSVAMSQKDRLTRLDSSSDTTHGGIIALNDQSALQVRRMVVFTFYIQKA